MQLVEPPPTMAAGQREPLARLATATAVGTAVKYYDFYLYTSVTALIFGPLFFPKLSMPGYAAIGIATGNSRAAPPTGRLR